MLQTILTVRIQLVIDLADEVWSVWLDSSDLEDAIVNIGINAMHAMDGKQSGARFTIRTCNRSLDRFGAVTLGLKAGDYVRLTLADTGTGMDEATRGKIFDPFFTTKGNKGTGLGLSQVFGFVKRAGGAIEVHSQPGQGSEFVLYFPRHLDADKDEAVEVGEDIVDLKGEENILVVDDELGLLDLTCELFSRQGYRTFRAENGKQALQILEREHIDLMLSDVIMPGMDGYQLAAIVREKYPAVQIQMASGFTDTLNLGTIDQGLHRKLLNKPYDPKVLIYKHSSPAG